MQKAIIMFKKKVTKKVFFHGWWEDNIRVKSIRGCRPNKCESWLLTIDMRMLSISSLYSQQESLFANDLTVFFHRFSLVSLPVEYFSPLLFSQLPFLWLLFHPHFSFLNFSPAFAFSFPPHLMSLSASLSWKLQLHHFPLTVPCAVITRGIWLCWPLLSQHREEEGWRAREREVAKGGHWTTRVSRWTFSCCFDQPFVVQSDSSTVWVWKQCQHWVINATKCFPNVATSRAGGSFKICFQNENKVG